MHLQYLPVGAFPWQNQCKAYVYRRRMVRGISGINAPLWDILADDSLQIRLPDTVTG